MKPPMRIVMPLAVLFAAMPALAQVGPCDQLPPDPCDSCPPGWSPFCRGCEIRCVEDVNLPLLLMNPPCVFKCIAPCAYTIVVPTIASDPTCQPPGACADCLPEPCMLTAEVVQATLDAATQSCIYEFAAFETSSCGNRLTGLAVCNSGAPYEIIAEDETSLCLRALGPGPITVYPTGGEAPIGTNSCPVYWSSVTVNVGFYCEGDANCDGFVDIADLLIVLGNYGQCSGGGGQRDCADNCRGDLSGDGEVGFADVNAVLTNYGECTVTGSGP